jgi:AraC-like DNA-binding protein
MYKVFYAMACILTIAFVNAQDKTVVQLKINNFDFETLENKIDNSTNEISRRKLISTYLSKAKTENNYIEISQGYNFMIHSVHPSLRLTYADSAITAAISSGDNATIGSAYLTKGVIYYSLKQHIKALDNCLLANTFIEKSDDQYLSYKTKYMIAVIKYYLGFYTDAATILGDCVNYFKNEDERAYLNSLHALALCFTKLGQYEKCDYYNTVGIRMASSSKDEMKNYFIHSQGVNQYFKKEYKESIQNLKSVLPFLLHKKDYANESVTYFYIAKNYITMANAPEALLYLKKVDKIFKTKDYIRPDIRENYELLIDYYKKNKNLKAELYYINQLLKVDSTLHQNFAYLSTKIHKEYDTKQLLASKFEVEESLKLRKVIIVLLIAMLSICLFVLYKLSGRKKLYKKKFTDLMTEKINEESESTNKNKRDIEIKSEIVDAILLKLVAFEEKRGFLNKDISLAKLAVRFDFNSKYISKVILYHRKKKFVEYINDLRIDYIVKLMKQDPKIRNYNNKALAEEAGFITAQHFTNAFNSRTGITPTYFAAQLQIQSQSS